jgi:hypothetical protein
MAVTNINMDEELLGSSPKSIFNYSVVTAEKKARDTHDEGNVVVVELVDFIAQLPRRIAERKSLSSQGRLCYDPIMEILR